MNCSDTLIGIDFGSSSVVVSCVSAPLGLSLWDKGESLGGDVEVLADELGLRSVPCAVAFRGTDEVIVGHAAIQQRSKNSANTFVDIRSLLCDGVVGVESGEVRHSIYVPSLDKELSTAEVAAHFFRHIVSQLKQRSSTSAKIVYDCAVALPSRFSCDDEASMLAQSRIAEAAKMAGLRIRGFCSDGIACFFATGLDQPASNAVNSTACSTTAVTIDVGWSSSQIYVYSLSCGFITLLGESRDAKFSVSAMVTKLVEFCTKDFHRRNKVDCSESARAILRIRTECENCLKILSNTQETTIVLESLYEGIDYSVKISRSRVEDLCGSMAIALKAKVVETLASANISPDQVEHLLVIGGGGTIPMVHNSLRLLCPSASMDALRKARVDPAEAVAIGACMSCVQAIRTHEVETAASDTGGIHLLHPINVSIHSVPEVCLMKDLSGPENVNLESILVEIECADVIIGSAKLRAPCIESLFGSLSLTFMLVEGHPSRLVSLVHDGNSSEYEFLNIPLAST